MHNMISKSLKVGAVALVLVAAAGCATTKDVDAAKAAAQKAQQDAAAAQATANQALQAAQAAAAAAKSAPDNAQSTANQALQAAQAAQAGVDATNQKLDRMFKQSVSK